MNRREERWGRSGDGSGDDSEWQRTPRRFRDDESDFDRDRGWGRESESQSRELGGRSLSGRGRWEGDTSSGRSGNYYGGREDYRGRDDYRSDSPQASRRGSGRYESEEPFGMSFDEGRVQWRRRAPGEYGSDRYGSGYEDRAGRGGYAGSGPTYGSGQAYGEDAGDSHGPQGFGQGGSRLVRYGRHDNRSMHGPYAGVGPKGYKRSPERLKEQVSDALEEHGYLDASDIEVKVEETTVTLTGTVDSRETKRLAEDLASSVNGINDVNNQLKVRSREEQQDRQTLGSEGTRSTRGAASRSSAAGSNAPKSGL